MAARVDGWADKDIFNSMCWCFSSGYVVDQHLGHPAHNIFVSLSIGHIYYLSFKEYGLVF
jgi:hypothetical protein